MSEHWDDHDMVRAARRISELEMALSQRREELGRVVKERDSLRARVAELEGALKDLVLANEEWNRATERIVGRPPGWSDAYLDRARRLLGREVEP